MVFGSVVIAFLLIALLSMVAMALTDSAFTTLKKRFFCTGKRREVEVEFIPGLAGLAGKRSGDVYSCSAFENKHRITCDRSCEDSESIRKIPAVFEGPVMEYPNP